MLTYIFNISGYFFPSFGKTYIRVVYCTVCKKVLKTKLSKAIKT